MTQLLNWNVDDVLLAKSPTYGYSNLLIINVILKNNYASQSIQLESGWYKYRMGQKVILYIDIRTVFYEY